MNVRLAAQVLSTRTAAAMEEILGDKVSETVAYIHIMNDWFDCLNVSNLTSGFKQRNENLKPFRSQVDPRLNWLKEFLRVPFIMEKGSG